MPVATPFSGLWIPLVTPWRDGAVDHPALAALTRRLCADGVSGLVACGSTGEAAALSVSEQQAVLETVVAAAGGVPVVCGVGGSNLVETLDCVRRWGTWPLAGLLVSAPQYVRPPQAGVRDWFERIADQSRHPLIVYDIPYRTGCTIARDTLLALADHANIAALKDCGGDLGKTLAVIAHGGLQVLAGEDLQMFSVVCQGGSGAIAASAHLATRRFVRLLAALREGDLAAARRLWLPLVPWIEAAFAEPNPGPVKALLAARGCMLGELRAPMVAPDPSHLRSVRDWLDRLDADEPSAARDRREEGHLARAAQ